MKLTFERVQEIKQFISSNLQVHSHDIVAFGSDQIGLSKDTIRKYLQQLIDEDKIIKIGDKKHVSYHLKDTIYEYKIDLEASVEEDIVWKDFILPNLLEMKDNVRSICQYAFTEMVNNVIDHSEGKTLRIRLILNEVNITLVVIDNGVGIFDKIQNDLDLPYRQEAIFQLQKGKFTSDSVNHTGEGIFFSSKMFDKYIISSRGLGFVCKRVDDNDGWLFESKIEEENIEGGTTVFMEISKDSDVTDREVFDKFSDPDSTPGFFKTICTLNLLQYEGEELISRSQAKRVITRFEKFTEVILDFKNVKNIGQGFADQIFRVFVNAHPETSIKPINVSEKIESMIKRVRNSD